MNNGEPVTIEAAGNGWIVRPAMTDRQTVCSTESFLVFNTMTGQPSLLRWLEAHFGMKALSAAEQELTRQHTAAQAAEDEE